MQIIRYSESHPKLSGFAIFSLKVTALLLFFQSCTLAAETQPAESASLLYSLPLYLGVLLLCGAFTIYVAHLRSHAQIQRDRVQKIRLILDTTLQNSQDYLWCWDISDSTFYYSPGCYRLIGYDPDEFEYTLESWKQLIHPEDKDKLEEYFLQHTQHPDSSLPPEIQFRIHSKNRGFINITMSSRILDTDSHKRPTAFIFTIKNLSPVTSSEQILQDRLHNLTRPLSDTGNISFSDIFDLKRIQELQDSFAHATNVASAIMSTDNHPLTMSSNHTAFCSLVRSRKEGQQRCTASNASFAPSRGTYQIKECLSGGLIDGCTSIWAGDTHIANWFTGQIRIHKELSPAQLDFAEKLELDITSFRQAYSQVPLMTLREFESICQTMSIIAEQLSLMAFQNIMQARTINQKEDTEKLLTASQQRLLEAQQLARIGDWSLNTEDKEIYGSKQFWDNLSLPVPKSNRIGIQEFLAKFTRLESADFTTDISRLFSSDNKSKTISKDLYFRPAENPDDYRYLHIKARITGQTENGSNIIEGTAQDITPRAQNEAALRKSQENLRIIFESIINGLVVTDSQGIITDINPITLDILQKKREDLLQTHASDSIQLFEAETMLMLENPITTVLNTRNQVKPKELCVFTTDTGEDRHLTVTASPINDPEGNLTGAVLVLYDVSEQFDMEQRLRQSQKLEAIGKLAGGIAHDFNNLLGGIMGFADLICINSKNKSISTYAKHIVDTTERAAELTRQLLSFARKEKSSVKNIDVHKCIEQALAILRHSIGTNIIIETELQAHDHNILGNATQIQNSIINLGINARDAIKEYGRFRIHTYNTQLDQEFCRKSDFKIIPGNYLTIAVTDTGCGIPSNNLKRIFEPFFTTKEIGKGTGLGLSAILGIIISHNGTIEVESNPNAGTTFILQLPITTNIQNNRKSGRIRSSSSRKTVLLADDQSIARTIGKSILEESGYKVLLAENGEQALKTYLEKSHLIDLVILDLVMPLMGGEETAEHLIKMNPDIKIIISSGMEESDSINHLMHEGKINAFITKPFTSSKLQNLIDNIL